MKNTEDMIRDVVDAAKHIDVHSIKDLATKKLVTSCLDLADSLKAEKYVSRSMYIKMPGQKVYDDAIEELFNKIDCGLTREGMMKFLMKKFHHAGSIQKKQNTTEFVTNASLVFWIDSVETYSEGWLPYTGGKCVGIDKKRWNNYCHDMLTLQRSSPLLDLTVRQGKTMELQYVGYDSEYANEFSGIVDSKRDFWFSAIPLHSDGSSSVARTLFLIYPNIGDEQRPLFANGIRHEFRFLKLASYAYQFLKQRDESFRLMFNEQRKEMISELGPGILHHELGQSLILLGEIMTSLRSNAAKLLQKSEGKELSRAISLDVARAMQYVSRVYSVTDSFNNLERKHPTEEFDLADVLEQAMTVCRYRLTSAGMFQNFNKDSLHCTMHSDAGLLLHLVINILTNAANACEHYKERVDKKLFWFRQVNQSYVSIFIGNNGPKIPAEFRDKIFESGYTLRDRKMKRGHGQGLYLCRQIARYLGGDIELFDSSVFDKDINVCFKINIALNIPKEQLVE